MCKCNEIRAKEFDKILELALKFSNKMNCITSICTSNNFLGYRFFRFDSIPENYIIKNKIYPDGTIENI